MAPYYIMISIVAAVSYFTLKKYLSVKTAIGVSLLGYVLTAVFPFVIANVNPVLTVVVYILIGILATIVVKRIEPTNAKEDDIVAELYEPVWEEAAVAKDEELYQPDEQVNDNVLEQEAEPVREDGLDQEDSTPENYSYAGITRSVTLEAEPDEELFEPQPQLYREELLDDLTGIFDKGEPEFEQDIKEIEIEDTKPIEELENDLELEQAKVEQTYEEPIFEGMDEVIETIVDQEPDEQEITTEELNQTEPVQPEPETELEATEEETADMELETDVDDGEQQLELIDEVTEIVAEAEVDEEDEIPESYSYAGITRSIVVEQVLEEDESKEEFHEQQAKSEQEPQEPVQEQVDKDATELQQPQPELETQPPTAKQLVSEGLTLSRAGNHSDAVKMLMEALKQQPEPMLKYLAVSEISTVYQHMGMYPLAANILAAYIKQRDLQQHPGLKAWREKLVYLNIMVDLLKEHNISSLPYNEVPDFVKKKAFTMTLEKINK